MISSPYTELELKTYKYMRIFSCSVEKLCLISLTPWLQHATGFLVLYYLLLTYVKFIPLSWRMPSNHLILCHTLPSFCLQSTSIRVFFSISLLFSGQIIRVCFCISPFQWISSGLISFRLTRFDDFSCTGSQESFSTRLQSINSSTLRLLYGPTSHLVYWLLKNP